MIKVALAYPAFVDSFKMYIPNLEVLRSPKEVFNYDLVIFSGGEDINPERYSETNRYSYINRERDDFEFSVFNFALDTGKKIFGVCRGHQLACVKHGGQLYQDLGYLANVRHTSVHPLNYVENHAIKRFFPKMVNSLHHQGINHHGSRSCVIAEYAGISEIESYKRTGVGEYCLTVQFHPEWLEPGVSKEFFNWLVNTWANKKVKEQEDVF